MIKFLMLSTLIFSGLASGYSINQTVNCADIPSNNLNSNLSYLWGRAIMHQIDRFVFLIFCPVMLILQIMIIFVFCSDKKLKIKPGNIFLAIVIFQSILNMHFFGTAIFYTIYNTNQPMPAQFPDFCFYNSLIAGFLTLCHMLFIILFPFYVIYILRFTLKNAKSKIWKIIYFLILILALVGTFLFWYFNLLGLNIFGLCGVTFIRDPSTSLYLPVTFAVLILFFLFFGIYAIFYFNKHMPNSIGLRRKKYEQNRILLIYVIGYSSYMLLYLIINILELVNCRETNPNPQFLPLVTVFNLIRLTQFIFIFIIIFKNDYFKRVAKKNFKKLFSKEKESILSESTSQKPKTSSFIKTQIQNIDYEDFLLTIRQQSNDIDILKMSQVVTIVSGIYVAYKQYYNLNEYFVDQNITQLELHSLKSINQSSKTKKSAKKIFYHQKMSIMIDPEIVKDYIIDNNILPKLGILKCMMTIHSPKIFQIMLEDDNLSDIFSSFQLSDNFRKMFDLVQGQGGRSGEFFFFSSDNKYVLKTINQQQFEFIDQNLFYFSQHFKRNPHSLLAKIYGLFTFKGNEIQRTYHIILMKNILNCDKAQIIRTYDLKGSKYDRQVINNSMTINQYQKLTLKDIDFMKMEGRLIINNDDKLKLRQIIAKDSLFLRDLNLIDYSLLVVKVKWNKTPENQYFWGKYQRIKTSFHQNFYYHIGIIDYLQRWDFQKKGEKWWKNFIGKKDISAQQPKVYQNRFINFIEEITVEFSFRDLQLSELQKEREKIQIHKQIYRYDLNHLNNKVDNFLSFQKNLFKQLTQSQKLQNEKQQRNIQQHSVEFSPHQNIEKFFSKNIQMQTEYKAIRQKDGSHQASIDYKQY